MVIDTSVIVSIMLEEEGSEEFLLKLGEADSRKISAISYMEASMVLITKRGEGVEKILDTMLAEGQIAIVPVSVVQAQIAREAFRRFGKGRHPAGLNFGDCFSYALAKHTGEPLLFKGDDFRRTDITPAHDDLPPFLRR
jgi:ribonuclease VapC